MGLINKKYTWKKDQPDDRDYQLKLRPLKIMPPLVDLRSKMPAVVDQGWLGSCTACAGAGAYHYTLLRLKRPAYSPSRLFIYYNSRVIDGTVSYDAGSYIRTCMKAMNKRGAPTEKLWPYHIWKYRNRPATVAYVDGAKHRAIQYYRVGQDLNTLKNCLAQGIVVVFGFYVFESFETSDLEYTGNMPMPQPGENILGGHAVVLVGYDDAKQAFIVRNSWGTSWGLGGYFYMPYSFVTNPNYCDDFWTLNVVQ